MITGGFRRAIISSLAWRLMEIGATSFCRGEAQS
jgi:hypothetical protein